MLVKNEKDNSAASIVQRIASGDKSAERELVDTYYRGLFFILNRQVKSSALAEDLAQDTFLIVIQKARRNEIKHADKIKAFIRQTGINLLIGSIRKEKRRATFTEEDIDFNAPVDDIEISKSIHSTKLLSITTQLINELKTPRDRDILRHFFLYDKQKDEICRELDLTPEHFDRVLFRARQRLKQLIQHKLCGRQDSGHSEPISRLLTVATFLCFSIPNSSYKPATTILAEVMRESYAMEHSSNETLNTNSRYLLMIQKSTSLTSMRGSV